MTQTRQHTFPDSSNIQSMKLSYDGNYTFITFKSKPKDKMVYYRYTGLSVEDFYKIIRAESVGHEVHELVIKPKLPFIKVVRERDPFSGRFVATKKES